MIPALAIRDGRLVPILPALGRTSTLENGDHPAARTRRVRALFNILEAVSAQYADA